MSNVLTTKQLQRTTGQVFAILSANGEFTRMVYDMSSKELPDGPGIMDKLIRQYRFDAVRCEILGVTLTVQITTERQGLQDEEDETQMTYCTSSCELFRRWLFKRLIDAGVTPKYSEHVTPMTNADKRPGVVKMDLSRKPFHPNRKR